MERQDHRQDRPASIGPTDDILATVRRRLLRQAFVFDDPATYAAGVEDALATVAAMTARRRAERAASRSVLRSASEGTGAVAHPMPAATSGVANGVARGARR